MSRMLSKMNLISVVQQLPKEDIETIQGYIEMIEEENQELKRNCNIGYENLNFYREENQELKLELSGYRQAILEDKDMLGLKEENQELKKQLEENKDKINWYENFEINKTIDKLRIKHNNQQKEFIDYLEKEIKRINPNDLDIGELNLRLDDIKFTQYLIYKEILSKYEEIIGGK